MGLTRRSSNLLPSETSREFMGVVNTFRRLGEGQTQQSSANVGFVEFKG
jgi:hypothetical protein